MQEENCKHPPNTHRFLTISMATPLGSMLRSGQSTGDSLERLVLYQQNEPKMCSISTPITHNVHVHRRCTPSCSELTHFCLSKIMLESSFVALFALCFFIVDLVWTKTWFVKLISEASKKRLQKRETLEYASGIGEKNGEVFPTLSFTSLNSPLLFLTTFLWTGRGCAPCSVTLHYGGFGETERLWHYKTNLREAIQSCVRMHVHVKPFSRSRAFYFCLTAGS